MEQENVIKLEDEEIYNYQIYSALDEIVYKVRFLYFLLTELDLMVSVFSGMAVWYVVDRTGSGDLLIFGLVSFDPWGVAGTIVLTASIISMFHWIRPEGNLELILKNLAEKKLLAPYTKNGDEIWTPSSNNPNNF